MPLASGSFPRPDKSKTSQDIDFADFPQFRIVIGYKKAENQDFHSQPGKKETRNSGSVPTHAVYI